MMMYESFITKCSNSKPQATLTKLLNKNDYESMTLLNNNFNNKLELADTPQLNFSDSYIKEIPKPMNFQPACV
jgi:hypothetical protein